MNEELEIIVQNMIDAGESEENIATVIEGYNKNQEPVIETPEVKAATELMPVFALPEIPIEEKKEGKFNTFGFLNPENEEEYNKNLTNFFDMDEETAQVQLQKILGSEYKITKTNRLNITKGDPELKKLKKSLFQTNYNVLKIKKGDKEVVINFGLGNIRKDSRTKDLANAVLAKDSKKLFDFVNQTMSVEEQNKSQIEQAEVLRKYNELNAPAVIGDGGEIIEPAGPLNVSQEEKDAVTNEFDAEDLFTPIQKTTSKPIGKFGTKVETQTSTEYPYADELKTARQELINDGVEDPTEEQIQNLARNTLKQNAVLAISDQKASDFLNIAENSDLDAILKLGGLMKQKITFNDKKVVAENQIKIKNSVTQFEKDQLDPNTDVGKATEFIKIITSTEPTVYDVDEIEKVRVEKEKYISDLGKEIEQHNEEGGLFLESKMYKMKINVYNSKIKEYNNYIEDNKSEERVILKNGTVMPKSKYDKYIVSLNIYNKQLDEIVKLEDQNTLDISRLKDEDIKYDLVRRNYNDAEKFAKSITGGFGDMAIKSAYGLRKITEGLVGVDNRNVDEDFIKWDEASSSLTRIRNKYQKDIKFENAFNKKNIGRFLLQEVQNQAPIFATIAMGPVGLGTLGLSSAGENWSRMVQEDKFYGSETSLLNKMLVSGGYGAAEILFDYYLTLPVMQRSAKGLFGTMKNFRTATNSSMKQYTKQFGKRQLIYDPFLETLSEVGTTGFQNLITGRPFTENMAHAAFSGGMFGTMFGHVPFYKGLVMQKFSDYGSFSGYRTNLNKIADLQITAKKLNTSLKANKTKGNDTSAIESNIETVNTEIESLNQENESTLKTVEKKTNNLSKKWFNIYNEATVEQEQIRIDVENIVKDESLSDVEKQSLIDIKQNRFDALQRTRDVLRDDKNFGNAYAAFRNSNIKEDQDRLQEIQGQATSELINEGTLEPKDDAIDARTKIIYNTQEINKDYNSKKSMLDGANFQNFQNVEKAVSFVNKMDLSDKDKQKIISGIEEGAHGVAIADNKGNITPIQVVENMAKDDRLETRTHETGHFVFAEAFGNNKKAFDGIAESILDFVKERNTNLHLRLINQVERDAGGNLISEEVLTNFLELVAEGKIDFDTKNNKGLGAFMASALNIGTKKSLGEKADLNFEGETDAINFLIKLGKKIKAGTLTIKDIKTIKRGKIAEKVKDKPETTFSKEASDKVQNIYNEKGTDGAFEIIEEFKPIVSRIAEKRREAPNFDKELLISEIEIGERGILDLIKEYKPESGVPLAAYINTYLPARAIEASKKVLGEEFTEDISEKVDIAAEEVEVEVKAKPKKKKIVLADRLNIVKEVDKAVAKIIPNLNLDKITFKNLKNKVPNIVGKLFGISPKKLITNANITKGELQKAQMFINKNADLLISMLPEGSTESGTATGVPNTLLKAFYTKADRAKMAKTGTKAGLAIQQKNKINKTEFLETFGIIDGKPVRTDRNTSARVLALANTLGKMITNQAVRQQIKTERFRALEDGKSTFMFSKDKELAERNGILYYDTLDNTGAETYVVEFVEKVIPIFKPGFLNATVAITTSTMPSRLVKDAKSMLGSYMGLRTIEFGANKDFARTKFNTELVRTKSDKEIQALNKRNVDNFEYMWLAIYDAVQKDKTIVTPLLHWLSGSVNEGTHPQRLGAELTHVDGTVKGKLYFEHALQNSNAYRLLMDAAINQNKTEFIKTLKALQDNYKLIAISAKDNTKINKAGYGLLMPEGWNIFDNNWWERYFNDKIAALGGINPENLRSIGSEKTLGQELNIGVDGQPKIIKSNLKQHQKFSKAINKSRIVSEPRGITVLDFDDTLATTKSLVRFTAPDGTKGTLNAEEYAAQYQDLLEQGYTFDFTEFDKVVKAKLAPLFQKALKLQKKFGPDNMFILTARPPAAQKAIRDFLKANGLNIPLKNITGLGNSTSEAKALWIAEKVGEGYNDFYFADDALQNVQAVKNMLDQFDVKSKVQQAKVKFSKNASNQFNDILETVTGIEAQKRFSATKARKRGSSKGKFRFFIPPSHEDFVGLLYNFMGKGKEGDGHRDFFEQNLIRPLNRAYREIDAAKQAIANDYKSLNKQFPDVKKKLTKKTPDKDFTHQDAIRVYLWDKHGYDIPGLSKTDQTKLSELVMQDSELQAYAETLNVISKQAEYVSPGQGWEGGNIKIDLLDATGRVGRAEFFAEFNENSEIIFSEDNLNKIEAAYGASFRSALEDMLHRIKTGVNRPKGKSGVINRWMNFLNGSVGAVMFFNMRSAILQQMSIVNYINFADNNLFAAAKAFANQKQYWKDFAYIFNSDMLKQRRGGIGTDINGAELAEAVSKAKGGSIFDKTGVLIGKLLQLGFTPTQIGDNIAIATGGATFYRNKINKYLKDGLSQKEAEAKAWTDFQNTTQSTQQSARPDMTSQQQSMWIGKMVLNFQNITSQYNRVMKKSASDIYNRRITPPNTTQLQSDMSNMSRILYYGGIQNLVFYSLQTALFAVMFGDEDEENDKFLKKRERVINGTFDSILRGSGIYGVAVSTLKNMAIKWFEQREKSYNKDESAVLMEALNFSPVVGIKARKLVNAEKTINYNENVISEMETFDSDNPQWSAATNYIEALTNFPVNRLYQKSINVRNALDNDYKAWQRALFFAGYTTWSLGLEDTKKMQVIKETVKTKKKEVSKEKAKIKKEQKLIEEQKKIDDQIKKEKQQEKEGKLPDPKCSNVSSKGKRCNISVAKAGDKCTIHESVPQNETGKKTQCKKIKKGGKRCGMKTSNKSGLCYYHD